MIRLESVNKQFGDKQVIANINANFEEGKTNLIIGQSGSGKTVLLKCIVGLFNISSGNIFYDNRNINELNRKERKSLYKEVGMVFQGGALFDSMTVEQNILFPLDMFTKQSREEKQKRVDFCLDRVNLENANKLFPAEISGGMRKRVAIARAIALNTQYLFCDEPNSGLDPQTAIVIDKLIQEITREFNITTIINTHDMNSVMEIGDNIIFIANGQLSWRGSKEDILHTNNKALHDFVFASELMKNIKLT